MWVVGTLMMVESFVFVRCVEIITTVSILGSVSVNNMIFESMFVAGFLIEQYSFLLL